jgi:hypothetical protein
MYISVLTLSYFLLAEALVLVDYLTIVFFNNLYYYYYYYYYFFLFASVI